ncbi:MAG: GH3 auxin-responsive promoter family protein [Bacteroidetes bacterium]|nr:GH3 auxin-responsive promoter family protein [Bacteroidota bacterium]MCH8523488.1 GH3 auxin-responsive promoter family protein [Balneolales bacterium]
MGIRSLLIKPYARKIARDIEDWSTRAPQTQLDIMRSLVDKAATTRFGKDHNFSSIRNYEDFKQHVPIRDYEELKPYVEAIKSGENDVLWPGRPAYFAKTSGTTSGVKYIPISKDSIMNHFGSARNASLNYAARSNNFSYLDGKLIFLSGSPELENVGGIPTGRLSGIVNHQVPAWLKTNQKPSYKTNCIEDWEVKVERIVDETLRANMTMISGIPPWVQMYYERLLARTGKKTIRDIFPNFSLFVYGGVNMEPYRKKLEELVGFRVDSVETYPASEGFIAFQDMPQSEGLLLNSNSGIFFEFIPADEFFNEHPTRLMIDQVEPGVSYAVIINNNAGLWGYSIGDTVEFLSVNPYRLRVNGRIKHYISAFGEHVIGKEVEEAMMRTAQEFDTRIIEFTVAPQVNPPNGSPYHEWFVEFDALPLSMEAFTLRLDDEMRGQNIYYDDLIKGRILRPLVVNPMKRDAFRDYMRAEGKLGGQNKVPRLANDRSLADKLEAFKLATETTP